MTIATNRGIMNAMASSPLILRIRWPVRLWHWINALSVFIMLMSGMMIFNAHPRLYWGKFGANALPATRRWAERLAFSPSPITPLTVGEATMRSHPARRRPEAPISAWRRVRPLTACAPAAGDTSR